jgi:3-deoxy-D-manno-octulosonate 8-phosphate phosphatase (KDO 8-P phosphatase)
MSLTGLSTELIQRASRVSVLLLDVDGALTAGRIVYAEYGAALKAVEVQDGAGLVVWHR